MQQCQADSDDIEAERQDANQPLQDFLDHDNDEESHALQECQGPILEVDQDEGSDQPPEDNQNDTLPENKGESSQETPTPENEGAAEESEAPQPQESEPGQAEETSVAPKDITSAINERNILTGLRTRTRDAPLSVTSMKSQLHVLRLLSEAHDAIAHPATAADPDAMTLRQDLKEPDADEFLEAMEKKVRDHKGREHWKLVTKKQIQKDRCHKNPVMAVWSMKWKRNPLGKIIKHKARLCAQGGQTVQGVHCNSTFAPVMTWTTIRFVLILLLVHKWHTHQLDFVLAHPQAKVSHDVCMHIPEKFKVKGDKLALDTNAPSPCKQDHKLRSLQNLCGLKDAGAAWFSPLKEGSIEQHFAQSKVNPCLFHKKDLVSIVCVDDCIMMTPKPELVDKFAADMKHECKLEDEVNISACLGINVTCPAPTAIKLNQPALIQHVIDSLEIEDDRLHDTPAEHALHRDTDGPPRKLTFNCQSVIGQLNCLTVTAQPDIQFATHRCARFSNHPKLSHKIATK